MRVRVTTVAVGGKNLVLCIMNVCLYSFTFSAPYLAYIFIFDLSGSLFPHYLINDTISEQGCWTRFSDFLYKLCLK